MRLYQHPISSNARRVLLTVAHLGIEVEEVLINLMSEEDRRRLAEINPNSKIPVLEDDGLMLWESAAIMQYLADKAGGHSLYPTELKARADVNRWMFWGAQHFSAAISVYCWENLWKKMVTGVDADPAELARGAADMEQFATVLDNHLAGREWVSGNALTLADYALAAPLMYLEKGRLPLTQYANIMAWFQRVQALPAWKQTEAEW
ncbi:glutathione S-transferase family protein [Pseudoduganella sp. UC29_106]|uniref:glutathione S-transferase family protein n=1 Tax=Pseudoduganella sp. UC29_106 TaxID=3374553 RepID=UPI0037567C2E